MTHHKDVKNPTVVRKFNVDHKIDSKGVKIAFMMQRSISD